MVSDWELWAVASRLIERHGAGARAFVAERQRALTEKGDSAGVNAWALILARLEQLEAGPPGPLQ